MMKKRLILAAMAAILTMTVAIAQRIAVVTEGGETSVYRTLEAAIKGASEGSVIYLPGGGFPLADSVKITKRLTIIGIGHKSTNDNVDGNTTISGNLLFNQGSDGSALVGCYVTGKVNISSDGQVNDVMIKYCSINSGIEVINSACQGTIISCNYVRGDNTIALGSSEATIKNNVIQSRSTCIKDMRAGVISDNIILGTLYNLHNIPTAIVSGNIFLSNKSNWNCGSLQASGNMCLNGTFGDAPIIIQADSWNDVFVNYNNGQAVPTSNFHFKDDYKQYESQVGVYAGGVDFDKQTAPVPYIVAKRIAEETDAAGQLKIQVRVNSGN